MLDYKTHVTNRVIYILSKVTTAFMESTKVKQSIIASMTGIINLSGIAFMHSSGKRTICLVSSNQGECHVNMYFILVTLLRER